MADQNPNPSGLEKEQSNEEFLAQFSENQADLKNAIAFLIHRRELLRDCEIEVLQHHCDKLIEQLADTKHRILLEELSCFKEVLTLHQRLLENDEPGN